MKEKQSPEDNEGGMTNVILLGLGAVSALYLINPTAGVFELIPDVIPLLGNLDEAVAATLLIGSLAHFGIDLTRIAPSLAAKLGRRAAAKKDKQDGIVEVESEEVD